MPFGTGPHHRDLRTNAGFVDEPSGGANQSAPLLLSDRGRYVWSDHPFAFTFDDGRLIIDGGDIRLGAGSAANARRCLRSRIGGAFPPSGRMPAAGMFTGPQYNTWMELPYAPTQQGVLGYVRGLLDAGFPPGVVMIDDRWSQDYGVWHFDPAAFPDPGAMVAQLHEWGCPVMLWLVPFVSPDSAPFRQLRADGLLLRGADGDVAIREWWNGFSAVLDVTHPAAVDWLCGELDALVESYGIDGFKFDAGDLRDYRHGDIGYRSTDPAGHCQAWAEIGTRYAYNEYRACWKMGGQPLAQRLHDKPSRWDGHGLASLIPESIAQGLIGHPFSCPDMVGGGDLKRTERRDARSGTLCPFRTARRAVSDDAILAVTASRARSRATRGRAGRRAAAAGTAAGTARHGRGGGAHRRTGASPARLGRPERPRDARRVHRGRQHSRRTGTPAGRLRTAGATTGRKSGSRPTARSSPDRPWSTCRCPWTPCSGSVGADLAAAVISCRGRRRRWALPGAAAARGGRARRTPPAPRRRPRRADPGAATRWPNRRSHRRSSCAPSAPCASAVSTARSSAGSDTS